MANKKHLAILRKGVRTWNQWREKNEQIVPNLRGADLSKAKLTRADLSWADLSGAVLTGAILGMADLSWADLSEADLSGTNLMFAKVVGANLREVNLSEALFGGTTVAEVDLGQVKGLEQARFLAPSHISTDTIYKSKGRIPENFLRECGVPDEMIDFLRTITGKAIEFYSCFISYSSKDDDFAKRVHADLQNQGVRVWFAPEDLKIGDKFPTRIDEAIRGYDKLMLVLSKHSINSGWVRREVQTALTKEKKEKRTVLFPIRLDDAFLDTTEDWADDIRRNRHVGDFKKWKEHDSYQAAFDRLLRDLKASEAK